MSYKDSNCKHVNHIQRHRDKLVDPEMFPNIFSLPALSRQVLKNTSRDKNDDAQKRGPKQFFKKIIHGSVLIKLYTFPTLLERDQRQSLDEIELQV